MVSFQMHCFGTHCYNAYMFLLSISCGPALYFKNGMNCDPTKPGLRCIFSLKKKYHNQATSHYLSKGWPVCDTIWYIITWRQWHKHLSNVNSLQPDKSMCEVTQCGLRTRYCNIDLGHHWPMLWLVAWWHQANYVDQCWLIINGVLCHSPETNFIRSAQEIN